MKVLVSGAAGCLGGQLIPELLEQGHEVRALDRRPERIENPDVDAVKGNVVSGDGLKQRDDAPPRRAARSPPAGIDDAPLGCDETARASLA